MSRQERLERGLVRQPNGCLEWQGSRVGDGYGQIRDGSKVVRTHRLAWELAYGPIPQGKLVRHKVCDNPPCCDVTHMALGTDLDNMADQIARGRHVSQKKTKCPQGHDYSHKNSRGNRCCQECITRDYHERKQVV